MNRQQTLNEYIAAREYSDDMAGDFAQDAAADSFFPRQVTASNDGFVKVFNYLYFNRNACSAVIDAFVECWLEYYKATTGRSWINGDYNSRRIISLDETLGEIDIDL